jgi:BMFP domain-containing protein YqiC
MSTHPPLPDPQLTALEQRVAALESALATSKTAIHYDSVAKAIRCKRRED